MKKRNYLIKIPYQIETETIKKGEELIAEIIKTMGLGKAKIEYIQDKRSGNQNDALHLYFEMLEQEAKDNGATMDMIIKNPKEVPITRHLLKDLFRLIGKTMYGKDSTAKLTKEEMSEVIKVFQKIVAERLHITRDFPSLESLENQYNQESNME